MKYTTPVTLEYANCPEPVKRRIETAFAWTIERNPFPQNIKERIDWIHTMEKALKTVEADSVMLLRLDSQSQR